jgi:DNA-directed RNA polymerase subunit RPC12/RpoP
VVIATLSDVRTTRWSRRRSFIDLREPGSYREGQVCARCGAEGRLVWADLVTKHARHECHRCGHGWLDAGEEAFESAV